MKRTAAVEMVWEQPDPYDARAFRLKNALYISKVGGEWVGFTTRSRSWGPVIPTLHSGQILTPADDFIGAFNFQNLSFNVPGIGKIKVHVMDVECVSYSDEGVWLKREF